MAVFTRGAAVSAFYRYAVRDWIVGRGYHPSLMHLHGDVPQKSEKEHSSDNKSSPVQSAQTSGSYGGLIDLAKEKPGLKKSEQFALALNEFKVREKYRKGHVTFIRTAVQRMDEFDLHKDLPTYNKILEIFPKGKYKPRKWIDAVWPRSTPPLELCLDILTKMEENGVKPNRDTYFIIKAAFGKALPLDKCMRIMYLFDKYQDMDPYEIRGELPACPVELSRLALFRITGGGAPLMEIKVPESEGTTSFVMAGSSERQLQVLDHIQRDGLAPSTLLHVEGPHRLWLKKVPQHYFSLRVSGNPHQGDMHIQTKMEDKAASEAERNNEGQVLGVCMCDRHEERSSLQRWIGALQEKYPALSNATIIYDITETVTDDTQSIQQAQ